MVLRLSVSHRCCLAWPHKKRAKLHTPCTSIFSTACFRTHCAVHFTRTPHLSCEHTGLDCSSKGHNLIRVHGHVRVLAADLAHNILPASRVEEREDTVGKQSKKPLLSKKTCVGFGRVRQEQTVKGGLTLIGGCVVGYRGTTEDL